MATATTKGGGRAVDKTPSPAFTPPKFPDKPAYDGPSSRDYRPRPIPTIPTSVRPADDVEQAQRAREAASAVTLLAEFELDGLIPIVDRWIRDGISTEEAMLRLRDTSTDAGKIFDARFPAIQLRRAAGLAPISPAEYVAYERSARQTMAAAGLPDQFWNTKDDFTNLLTGDVSIAELNTRVNQGFVEVARAPAEVRAAFNEFFGANGDAALASFFLDKDRALPVLQEYVETAKVAGAGKQFGVNLSQERADRIRQTGVGFEDARSGFSSLSNIDSLFTETVSEASDLAADREGVDAIFGLDQGQAQKTLTRRLDERVGAFSGSGGAAGSERGAFGLGSARR